MNISSNIGSAFVSGSAGIQRASDGITQNASNLANLSAVSSPSNDSQEFLANATLEQANAIKQVFPQGSEGVTSNLLGLSINLTHGQASSKVVDTANDAVGTILDIMA